MLDDPQQRDRIIGLLKVADLDTSLHPLFAAEVLRLFQDPAANPNNAQLVCTVHDATLLGRTHLFQPLERDQVRITVKNRDGVSEIYPLTDARPRKTEALDRNYLAGAYGGVPRLTVGEIAETLAGPLAEPSIGSTYRTLPVGLGDGMDLIHRPRS
jgi:AAA15 family ATPase/GTPase